MNEEVLTLPWYTSEPYYKMEPPSLRSFFVVPGTQKRAGDRSFKTIVLENQFILLHGAQHTGSQKQAAAAKEALDQLLKEPGAKARLAEFEAATRGEYKAPLRIQNCK